LGEGSLYLTKADPAPDGAIVKPMDFQLGLFQTVVGGLDYPSVILCGPDGRLYVTEFPSDYGRIDRFNQDGTGRQLVFNRVDLGEEGLVFAPNGDLFFGTVQQGTTQGIWRIPGALQAGQQFNPAQQVLPVSAFKFLGSTTGTIVVAPYAFLSGGPFQGDLLMVEYTNIPPGPPGGRVLRAPKPDFSTVMDFIAPFTDPQPFHPAELALNSTGDVFVTDYVNGKIRRFGPDGSPKGIFADVPKANQIAIGPDDLIYVTNIDYENGAERGGLFVFDPQGKLLSANAIAPMHLRGVTVCPPK
jgi:streptogramin lyase